MMLSAIYPRVFGEALSSIMGWLRTGSSIERMNTWARGFLRTMPTCQASYEEAKAASQAIMFSDKDPGWATIHQDLPLRMAADVKKRLLKTRRLARESYHDPLAVSSGSQTDQSDPRPCHASPVHDGVLFACVGY